MQPMAARVVDKLPEGDEWSYEVKFDGYRALLMKDGERLQIRSRNDKDLTQAYPSVATAGRRIQARQAVIDGEIVAVDKCGAAHYSSSAGIRHSKRFTTDLRTPSSSMRSICST